VIALIERESINNFKFLGTCEVLSSHGNMNAAARYHAKLGLETVSHLFFLSICLYGVIEAFFTLGAALVIKQC